MNSRTTASNAFVGLDDDVQFLAVGFLEDRVPLGLPVLRHR